VSKTENAAKIGIVTDSNSSIVPAEAERLGISVVPMPFYIDGECYYENVDLSREDFFAKQIADADIETSTPSPLMVMEAWDAALAKHEQILYIPMSSALSSSCEFAMTMAREEKYAGRVFVVDNGRVATPMHRSILDAIELIEQGFSAERVKELLEEHRADMAIFVAVDDLKYLKKGGRISATSATIGAILNVKPVLQFDVGKLSVYAKSRGKKRARLTMLEAMKETLQTRFKEQYERGDVYLLAACSASAEETEDWLAQIREAFPDMPVMYDDLALSLSAHIGYGGLGIGCSCKIRP
jgi:DegV family protein with EDD domain